MDGKDEGGRLKLSGLSIVLQMHRACSGNKNEMEDVAGGDDVPEDIGFQELMDKTITIFRLRAKAPLNASTVLNRREGIHYEIEHLHFPGSAPTAWRRPPANPHPPGNAG